MEGRFVVIENTPGYLPEEDEPFEGTYAECVEYADERADEYENDADGDYTVDRGWASSGNYYAISVTDNDRTHDLGRWIAVERLED